MRNVLTAREIVVDHVVARGGEMKYCVAYRGEDSFRRKLFFFNFGWSGGLTMVSGFKVYVRLEAVDEDGDLQSIHMNM